MSESVARLGSEHEPGSELQPQVDPVAAIVHGALGAHVEAEAQIEDAPSEPSRQLELVTATGEQAKADEAAAVFFAGKSHTHGRSAKTQVRPIEQAPVVRKRNVERQRQRPVEGVCDAAVEQLRLELEGERLPTKGDGHAATRLETRPDTDAGDGAQ